MLGVISTTSVIESNGMSASDKKMQRQLIALGTVTFTMPDGKTYTYTHPRYKDYKVAAIINLKPL